MMLVKTRTNSEKNTRIRKQKEEKRKKKWKYRKTNDEKRPAAGTLYIKFWIEYDVFLLVTQAYSDKD